TCADGVSEVCKDDTCGVASRIQRLVVAEQPYFIVVDGFNGAYGNFTLEVIPPTTSTTTTTTTTTSTTAIASSTTTTTTGTSITSASCVGTTVTLSGTTPTEAGGNRCSGGSNHHNACTTNADCPGGICKFLQCTTAGCLFGPPLPIPNSSHTGAATSTCVVNVIFANASGTADCS